MSYGLSPAELQGFGHATTSTTIATIQPGVAVATNGQIIHRAATTVCNITGTGAGGLDTGTPAANTFYHLFMIVGTGVNALFSLSPTAPTLPAGFTGFRRIGACFSLGANTIIGYRQVGNSRSRDIIYADNAAVAPGLVLSGGNATTPTTVSLTNRVPSTADYCNLMMAITSTAGVGVTRLARIVPANYASNQGLVTFDPQVVNQPNMMYVYHFYCAGQTIDYEVADAVVSLDIQVFSYTDQL